VKYWMHNGLMRASTATGKVGGKGDRDSAPADEAAGKISRSKGAGGLAQLIEKHTGERIRFFLLKSHYRSTSVFGDEPLHEAGVALEAFYRLFQRFQRISGLDPYTLEIRRHRAELQSVDSVGGCLPEMLKLREGFLAKMDDDFNTGGAMGDLFEMARCLNRFIENQGLDSGQPATELIANLVEGMKVLREMAAILGLFQKPLKVASGGAEQAQQLVEGLMQLVIQLRAEARGRKDFATSDTIRDGLNSLGITLQDGKAGTVWGQSK
ncbi:MAG: DALR domain-containing protein, partial [Pirellulaceae bacterium]